MKLLLSQIAGVPGAFEQLLLALVAAIRRRFEKKPEPSAKPVRWKPKKKMGT